MELYNKDNEAFEFDDFELFTKGGCASIYKYQDILLKVYSINCKYRFYMNRKLFEYLKECNIPNFVELIDYFRIFKSRILPMDAYTMKYVEGKNVKLITADKEYLTDVGKQLDETIKKLSDYKIVIFDAQCDNILFKENGVTIIDPDQFAHRRLTTKGTIYGYNKQEAMNYITDTITKEMNLSGYTDYAVPLIFPIDESIEESLLSLSKEGNIRDTVISKGETHGKKIYALR